ncbi:DNA-binding response regulator, OmpR family, contains REC and winged-helix (wHTH) domain [Thermoactinomyces sp. DSM 45891]|uniref:response regulator transcription factor n=1 Tax=Thermoactinomyces sp. DSM 45891 TaxID=1761907 RepID=UPI00091E8B59|nr:response regulator transcription factor [Thermoactinomyces sp. DSM 45891]SFX10805.1 DNA-binding response regulator, OmpR family, contains REC and winged-helix (wHTH) domain [Thermoactinomyces sp. DSM 45891]
MDKILFVEDDESLGLAIEFSLKSEGFDVTRVTTVAESKLHFQKESFDVAILDIGLPDGNGYDLCTYLKSQSNIPIIFLTALDEEANVVMGLEMGGDDYVTKPFRLQELLSRVRVQLRKKLTTSVTELISSSIKVEVESTKVFKDATPVSLTNLEYKLLLTLMSNAHRTMQRDEILEKITTGDEVFFDENTLSVYIRRLRSKIEDDPKNPACIVTQRGLGYRWDQDVIESVRSIPS